MKLSQVLEYTPVSMSKTINHNMYSTMVPPATPRRRYVEAGQSMSLKKQSVLEKSIHIDPTHLAATFTKGFRREIKPPQLPQIKSRKSMMMEEWINQELQKDGGEVSASNQPLKTLKKYSFDKATLRNLNLSHQTINKLYSGLYVYTEGVKHAFSQMLNESTASPRQDNFLPLKYFQVFLKLLQNAIPVKSTFTMTENVHLKNIASLKNDKLSLLLRFQKQEKTKVQSQRKLNRQIEQLQSKLKQIQLQNRIAVSTLQMYEMNFNDEVHLRLKFEEKINRTYTSYQQLKNKFEALKQDLGIKNDNLNDFGQKTKYIKEDLQNQKIRNIQLENQIQRLNDKIKALQGDIVVNNQEILDIKLQNHSEEQNKQLQQNALDQLLVTIRLLTKQKEEAQLQIKLLQTTSKTQYQTIQKLKVDLSTARQKNDDLYLKNHENTLILIPLEKDIYQKSLKLAELMRENEVLKTGREVDRGQLEEQGRKLKLMQEQMTTMQKDRSLLDQEFMKLNESLKQLKDVKDRYQRINAKLTNELYVQREEISRRLVQLQALNMKKVDLQFHLSQMQKLKRSFEDKLSIAERQLFKNKSLTEERRFNAMTKIKSVQEEIQLKEMEIVRQKKAFEGVLNEISRKDTEKLNKLDEICLLRKQNQIHAKELKDLRLRLQQTNSTCRMLQSHNSTLEKTIENKAFTIQRKKNEIEGETVQLRLTVSKLREQNKQRAQYVHPMVVEDLIQQIQRLYLKITEIKREYSLRNSNYARLQEQLRLKKGEVNVNADEMNKLNQHIKIKLQQIEKANQWKKEMEGKNKELQREISQLKSSLSREKQNGRVAVLRKDDEIKLVSNSLEQLKITLKESEDNLAKKLLKPPSKPHQQQTDPIEAQVVQSTQTSIQTDPIMPEIVVENGNGQKLTTMQKMRLAKKQEQFDKKQEGRQFKAALKMTYMRK